MDYTVVVSAFIAAVPATVTGYLIAIKKSKVDADKAISDVDKTTEEVRLLYIDRIKELSEESHKKFVEQEKLVKTQRVLIFKYEETINNQKIHIQILESNHQQHLEHLEAEIGWWMNLHLSAVETTDKYREGSVRLINQVLSSGFDPEWLFPGDEEKPPDGKEQS